MLTPTTSETESDVKTVLAWASISYAFGFATVTLHTYRLGLPVLEILSAVYIWIGLPLATVAFFSKRLARLVKAAAVKRATVLRESWVKATEQTDEKDLNVVAMAFSFVATVLPPLSLLEPSLTRLVERANIGDSKGAKRAALYLKRLAALVTGARAVFDLAYILYALLTAIFLVYLYVWQLYPLIPQTLGGGRPRTVQLVILSDKSAAISPYIQQQQPTPGPVPVAKSIVTPPLTLLYMTKENYYLQSKDGRRFSLSAAAVEGVVWNPR